MIDLKQRSGMTGRELAEQAELSPYYVSLILNRKRKASLQAALKIAKATENKITVKMLRPDLDLVALGIQN